MAGRAGRAAPAGMLPLRVLMKGDSSVVYASWMGGPRHELGYPRVLERELRAAGFEVEVRVTALPAERVRMALRRWPAEVLTWSPDVVVLHYGHADLIHLYLPRWLERHVHSLATRPGPIRSRYRRRLLRPTWIGLAKLQVQLDRRLPAAIVTRRARRVARQLAALVDHVRWANHPLVLIPDVHEMGASYQGWFPGIEARMGRFNDLVREDVARRGADDVQVVPVREAVAAVAATGRDPVPDGSHFTPEAHEAVGRLLAARIAAWAATQPHLAGPLASPPS